MNRLLITHTPLGDALWAVSLVGREALSTLYYFALRFKSDVPDIDCQAMIGELCAVELEADRGGKRYLSGQMINFSAAGRDGRHWVYEATLAPRLWHASRRTDFRIWQNQTVPDIVRQVLIQHGIRYDQRLKLKYKTWEYLTQHGDTDLDFICRQLEHEGILFWFEHDARGETLVLADHFTCHPNFPGYALVPFYPPGEARAEEDHFDTWRLTRQVEPGRFEHTDYDFTKPVTNLTTCSNDPRGHLFDQYQHFAYPGNYTEPSDGDHYAANALERLQCKQEIVHLEGRVRGAAPGYYFTLTEHPRADLNRELLTTAARYDIADNAYEASQASTASRFRIRIEAMPANRPFRPPLVTPKPRTRGPQTAVVVGPAGEEIFTDRYGRVKVHFHWDRYGKKDGTDTCWIRVAHASAGANFGAIHIPRIGQEVIVDFEHGDPDRPIITGRVYNAAQMPPWDLPENKTQSGILTRSSKGGSAANANALRFEDLKGAEQVWLHAERNHDIEVELNETHWVGQDRCKTIDRDETTYVKRHRTETVDGNETLTVLMNRTEAVSLNETIAIGLNRTESVGANETLSIAANRSVAIGVNETRSIGGQQRESVGSVRSVSVGRSDTLKVGTSRSTKIARNDTTTIGLKATDSVGLLKMTNVGALYSINVSGAMNTAVMGFSMEEVGVTKQIQAGREFNINAGERIQITCGKSMISMDSTGMIKIVGTLVQLEGQDIVHAEGAISTAPPTHAVAGSGGSLLSGLASSDIGSVLGIARQVAGIASAVSSGDLAGVLGNASSLLGLGSPTLGNADANKLEQHLIKDL
ncbi:type VI secretion system Vgr family protein [Parazoarcus communis]|uniref:Type VI secretion system tip protein VgrG n=1 Tax=Parazoarcus communis SWub3 = DSM 12120 TaxID=1121029 RepID=A0A323UQ88_9RHOO|nr:type VI secretion system tip protein TssI/VgrG [Parazoarcus communis]NMG72736.1 type VI secretion system tip protein VgrG [Parazoarcus communis SWub3 = DSM 12120]PZA14664.1 type VI secretion system tip protein VgrG [Azoarcus communis] [Parazoarcus communis SWub3 = DSM 12120]